MNIKTFWIEKILGKCDHDWAKCIHPANRVYLYGQKFCVKCKHRSAGFAEKEIDKNKSVVANTLVFNWD